MQLQKPREKDALSKKYKVQSGKTVWNTFTLVIIFIGKSLQIEVHSTNLLLWPVGIFLQSHQSATAHRILTLP